MPQIQSVILSGGSGTRLWPVSRTLYPKQFADIKGDTLFSRAVARASALPESLAPIVVCNDEHRFFVAAALQQHGLLAEDPAREKPLILLEPTGRNTALAVTLAALAARNTAPDASAGMAEPLLLVLSSDHLISPQDEFARAVAVAREGARQGRIVIFGVPPTRPETAYGYIRQGGELSGGLFSVAHFVEKPDLARAEDMLRTGQYLWNSGMFMFAPSVILDELERHAPAVYEAGRAIWESRRPDLDFMRFSDDRFRRCPSVSIDVAVMEKTDNICMVPLDAAWRDMGSWEAFYETSPKDEAGNALYGDAVQLESRDCYLHSSHRLVAALGVDGISVVETADAVLVMPRERNQDVKNLVEMLKISKREEVDSHVRVYRPWGSYELLACGERFQVKRIIVKPGGVLSLQLHYHRAEHWIVVRGTARVIVDDTEALLREDQSTYIPSGTMHRLENPGRFDLEIIEVQTGAYLGEDDIVRFDDTYGRVPAEK